MNMFGTYRDNDVTLLLKDITGLVEPQTTEEREKEIQNGRHYCEMLPIEYRPSDAYVKTFNDALSRYSKITADAVAKVAQKIWNRTGEITVLVSLARAGTPIGVLIKRYIKKKYGCDLPHYSISIIRGKGIDNNAMLYLLNRYNAEQIQFIDGWTGKGAIQNELIKAMSAYPGVRSGLAVLSDPAGVADIFGTIDDFLIASSCLNSTVSGLISRTFLRDDIIGENDYHGAVFYKDLMKEDVTYRFIETIEQDFDFSVSLTNEEDTRNRNSGLKEIKQIAKEFNVKDINMIKPSIGETTRVLLRRLPWKILVHNLGDYKHLGHLYQLAKEKKVDVIEYPLINYKACGIIKNVAEV